MPTDPASILALTSPSSGPITTITTPPASPVASVMTEQALDRRTVIQWVSERHEDRLAHWLAHGKPHKRLAHEAWDAAVHTGWLEGAQQVWNAGWGDPATMIESAWPWMASSWPKEGQDPSTSALAVTQHPLEALLTTLTWGPALNAAHAKAQPNARIAALAAATTTFNEQRWCLFWANGVDVTKVGGRTLLTRLLCQRFGVGWCSTGWQPPTSDQAQAMDRCLDRLLEAHPPFPWYTVAVVGLINDPVLGEAARRHVFNWVKRLRHEGRLARAITMAEHGVVIQALGHTKDVVNPGRSSSIPRPSTPNPDAPFAFGDASTFASALFQAWLAQDVETTVTLRPQDWDPKRGLDVRFGTEHLRVGFDARRSEHGRDDQTVVYAAAFASPVVRGKKHDQTFSVAEHWFATALPDFKGWNVALNEAQRDACLGLWNLVKETPLLRAAMNEPNEAVISTIEPSRSRRRL